MLCAEICQKQRATVQQKFMILNWKRRNLLPCDSFDWSMDRRLTSATRCVRKWSTTYSASWPRHPSRPRHPGHIQLKLTLAPVQTEGEICSNASCPQAADTVWKMYILGTWYHDLWVTISMSCICVQFSRLGIEYELPACGPRGIKLSARRVNQSQCTDVQTLASTCPD